MLRAFALAPHSFNVKNDRFMLFLTVRQSPHNDRFWPVTPYGANIRTNRMKMLPGNVMDNQIVG
jgi:hypothetical protein